jgi:hypothetical protein
MGERRIDDTDRDDENGIDNAAIARRLGRVVRVLERAANRMTNIRDGIAQPVPDDGKPQIVAQLDAVDAQTATAVRLAAEIRAIVSPR